MLEINKSLPKVEHDIDTESNNETWIDGFCGILKFYSETFVLLLWLSTFHFLTHIFSYEIKKNNFIGCLTLSRNVLAISPGLLLWVRTQEQTGWPHAKHESLPRWTSLKQRALLSKLSNTGPHSFSRCQSTLIECYYHYSFQSTYPRPLLWSQWWMLDKQTSELNKK